MFISDIWTGFSISEYLAVSKKLVNASFQKRTIIMVNSEMEEILPKKFEYKFFK